MLEHQPAQHKIAEEQLKKAERDAAGHIMGNFDDKKKLDGGGCGKGGLCAVDNINKTKKETKDRSSTIF